MNPGRTTVASKDATMQFLPRSRRSGKPVDMQKVGGDNHAIFTSNRPLVDDFHMACSDHDVPNGIRSVRVQGATHSSLLNKWQAFVKVSFPCYSSQCYNNIL